MRGLHMLFNRAKHASIHPTMLGSASVVFGTKDLHGHWDYLPALLFLNISEMLISWTSPQPHGMSSTSLFQWQISIHKKGKSEHMSRRLKNVTCLIQMRFEYGCTASLSSKSKHFSTSPV